MCKIMEEVRNEGVELGREEGGLQVKRQVARRMYNRGDDLTSIAEAFEATVNEVREWIGLRTA